MANPFQNIYNEALHSKKSKVAGKMKVKASQKGKGSLEIPKSKTGKNEGNTMMEGKNEHNRS